MKKINNYLLLSLVYLTSVCILFIGCDKQKNADYGKYTRQEMRYYAYAPPNIPHEVINRRCIDCHLEGLVVQGFRAPVTPHPTLVNCEQCHVRADQTVALFKENHFVGEHEETSLGKPQPAGPPLIPHRIFMRENCVVCHNDSMRKNIVQTTHPERSNCVQCHVAQQNVAEASLARAE